MEDLRRRDEQVRLLVAKIRKHEHCMLTTMDDELGTLRSRPMRLQEVEDDGTLWFITSDVSAKAVEINHEHHVNLAFIDESEKGFVSLSGIAAIQHDEARVDRYWRDADDAWFPKGQDDPQVVLIRVEMTDAEYWEGPSRVVQLYAAARAITSGKPASGLGEHLRVSNH